MTLSLPSTFTIYIVYPFTHHIEKKQTYFIFLNTFTVHDYGPLGLSVLLNVRVVLPLCNICITPTGTMRERPQATGLCSSRPMRRRSSSWNRLRIGRLCCPHLSYPGSRCPRTGFRRRLHSSLHHHHHRTPRLNYRDEANKNDRSMLKTNLLFVVLRRIWGGGTEKM